MQEIPTKPPKVKAAQTIFMGPAGAHREVHRAYARRKLHHWEKKGHIDVELFFKIWMTFNVRMMEPGSKDYVEKLRDRNVTGEEDAYAFPYRINTDWVICDHGTLYTVEKYTWINRKIFHMPKPIAELRVGEVVRCGRHLIHECVISSIGYRVHDEKTNCEYAESNMQDWGKSEWKGAVSLLS